MKTTLSIIFFLSATFVALSQTTFQRTIGTAGADAGYSVQELSGGGYIISGYTNDAADSGIYLARLAPTGGLMWSKVYNFSQVFNYDGSAVRQTYDGGFIITGYASERVDLIKTDALGDTMWTRTYGGSVYDVARSVIQTSDSGYAVLGATISFGAGAFDIYLLKTDASGNLLWTRTYGGTGEDQGYEVQQTFDGGYIITGITDNNSTNPYYACLIKTDAAGNMGWTRNIYEVSPANFLSYGYSVKQTADSGYVMAGRSRLDDVYLVKTDSAGNITWSNTYGGAGIDFGNNVQQTTDGGYIVAGYTADVNGASSFYLVKTDASGNMLWTRAIGGSSSEEAKSVAQTSDGGYIVVGLTSSFGSGGDDIYVIKMDSAATIGCNEVADSSLSANIFSVSMSNSLAVNTGGALLSYPSIVSSNAVAITLCTVGLESEVNASPGQDFTISPNPANDKFEIRNAKSEIREIEIFNTLGEKIFSQRPIADSQQQVEISALARGIYLVKIKTDKGISSSKFVKQ